MSEGPAVPGDTSTSRTIIVRVSHATHKLLRLRVAEEDTSIQKWVEALIERELKKRPSDRKAKS
jgi:predicted HicB family RNase H-like nuclease